MKKEQLEQIVIETLGFNPKEFKYKLDEHDQSIEAIKKTLQNVMPIIGATIMEFNLIKKYLADNKLDPSGYIKAGMQAAFEANKESLARYKLVVGEEQNEQDGEDDDGEEPAEKPRSKQKRKLN